MLKKMIRRFLEKLFAVGGVEFLRKEEMIGRQIEAAFLSIAEIAKQNEAGHKMMVEMINQIETTHKMISQISAESNISAESKDLDSKVWNLIPEHTHLGSKFFPYKSDASFYHIPKQNSKMGSYADPDALPVPPKHLWEGYAETDEQFLETGNTHMTTMLEILAQDDFQIKDGFKVMEFGCAAERMLRWLAERASKGEFWGVDICAEHIIWCQQHLTPPFHFFTTTTEPHMPFSDGYFDFIYAGSVFTHISELADSWFLELRRIIRKGGRLYITIHDRHTIKQLFETDPTFFLSEHLSKVDKETDILSTEFDMFAMAMFSHDKKRNPKGAMVFYDIDYLERKFRDVFIIKSINQDAYGVQTAMLLEIK